jgi:hypothetical protein
MDANEMMMEENPASKTQYNFNILKVMDNVQYNNFAIKTTHFHFSSYVESSYMT